MISIKFPEANHAIAEHQEEYQTLHVHVDPNDLTVAATMCFELSPEEKQQVAETGKIYFTQLTFGNKFQPIRMSALNPFVNPSNDEHDKDNAGNTSSIAGE